MFPSEIIQIETILMWGNNDNVDINKGVAVITEKVKIISIEITKTIVTQRPKLFRLNTGKYGPEKTSCLDTFHTVEVNDRQNPWWQKFSFLIMNKLIMRSTMSCQSWPQFRICYHLG